ncbi:MULTISPECIES: DNA polymerase [unclassified Roseobacter]|uniref:DNA polymerase n=1 Tax=unclassified Roseobacter TaxID=196798 RepID=UPI00149273F1|nr:MULTISPECIES: DNA polymerase [unclassified Roseobacter]NNW55494.1 hypothetical protein [Roseobacter sp. HKCCD8284]NNY17319.1 hypothetical protein [Roseobacter sp. HKCCD8191]
MAKLFDTQHLTEKTMKMLSANEASWVYNGLDCCVTSEVYNNLREQLDGEEPRVQETHKFAKAKLAPYMEMSLRGLHVDLAAKERALQELKKTRDDLDRKFQRIMVEVFGGPINWNSPTQVKQLLYTQMALKPVRKRNSKGFYMPTVNEEALEYLKIYIHARPIISFILTLRGIAKTISFLNTKLDTDNRIRTSFNLAGTVTGRLSSAESEFGSGTNLQNVDRSIRYIFTPDPGMYMVNIDLEQADARNVGAIMWNMFYDKHGPEFAGSYLNACESSDLHTAVCRMAWPNLQWPDDESEWKKYCSSVILYGQDSYRQIAKKLGHGTNYYGTPPTMARHTHTPVQIIKGFQRNYFNAFPVIPLWQNETISLIQDQGVLYNLFGRRRHFFGRGNDAKTHRDAIAYSPQSSTGEQIDRGLFNVWRSFDIKLVQFLVQVHDSILFQIPYAEAEELIPLILQKMQVVLELKGGRSFTIPLEVKAGWNWGDYDDDNPDKNPLGLKSWTGKEERERPSPRRRLKDYL